MKKGSTHHCARGEVVNLDDLAEALSKGHVAGAALDVFLRNPRFFQRPSSSTERHIHLTWERHRGGAEKVAEMIAQTVVSYLLGRSHHQCGDFPSIPWRPWPSFRLHLDLANGWDPWSGRWSASPAT